MQYKESDLFSRLVELETQALTISEDIKQLKKDFTFNKKSNPSGLDKENVKLVSKSAKLHAKRNYEETRADASAVFRKYEELTGYND